MDQDFTGILSTDFAPLSEVKAKLSERIRSALSSSKKTVITINGRPAAVLLAYQDYLALLRKLPGGESGSAGRVISLKEWEKGQKNRREITRSIAALFDVARLSRKGQKAYKREGVRALTSQRR